VRLATFSASSFCNLADLLAQAGMPTPTTALSG